MKTAAQSASKYSTNAAAASGEYVTGAESTTKDQAAAAAAAATIWQQALTASFSAGSFAKGLQRAGKTGWLNGIRNKGAMRFADGVSNAQAKYAERSAKFDTARAAASTMPRGIKGSAQNLQKVTTVVNALIAAKKS